MGKKGWKGHRKSIPHNTPSKSPQNNGAEKQQPSANEIPAIDSSNAAVETENRERDEQDGDRQQDISADLPKEGKLGFIFRTLWHWISFPFRTANHVQATAAIVMAAVTTAYAIIAAFTLAEFKTQTGTLAQQLNELKTNDIISQRASIILSDMSITPIKFGPQLILGYLGKPEWENVGNTIATDVTTMVTYQFSHDELPPNFTANDPPGSIEGPSSLGPKQIIKTSAFRNAEGVPIVFPQDCAGRFRYAYIWGRANYRDLYRPSETRVTRFCWRVYGFETESSQLNYTLCGEGNCQDHECDYYNSLHVPKLPNSEICGVVTRIIVPTSPPPPMNPTPMPSAPPAQQSP